MKHILAIAAALVAACSLLSPAPRTNRSAPAPTVAASTPQAAAAPAAPACPDLTLDITGRTIDTRKAETLDPKKYDKMKWAPGHRKPVGDAFALPAAAAVDKVVAIEAAQPQLLPAGFRDQLLASPRDPALRLQVAACELESPMTRRRASYDAALALLLGGDSSRAEEILEESTRNGSGSNSVRSCSGDDCPSGQVCDVGHGECMTDLALGITYIAEPELEIEDALTRGVIAIYTQRNGDDYNSRDALFWWGNRRVHRCGKQRCAFEGYESTMAVWDLRDGGTARPLQRSDYSDAEWKIKLARDRCYDRTGSWTVSQCTFLCDHYRRGKACRDACERACDV